MNARQFINRNPTVMAVVVIALIAACLWVVWRQTGGSPSGEPPKTAFYTIDDGKTWFVDDIAKLTPFDREGKPAVRAFLFKCGEGSEPVVGYMERYTTKGKEVTERYRAEQQASPGVPPKSLGDMASLGVNAVEIKKPGEANWVPKGRAMQTLQYSCGNGTPGVPVNP
jgi:hypothetical protein